MNETDIDDFTKWASFPKLNNLAQLERYMDFRRIAGHKNYFHYTKLGALECIIRDRKLRLSPFAFLNDTEEKKELPEDEWFTHFLFCFTSGENENLPMWYLYSGVDGKGVRIQFTKAKLNDIIRNSEVELQIADERIPLTKGKDYNIALYDVLYYKQKGGYVDLKYNNLTNYDKISTEGFTEYKNNHLGFTKKIIWFFEKETRLLVNLIGERAEYVKKYLKTNYLDKNLLEAKESPVYIYVFVGERIRHMKFKLAPEYENEQSPYYGENTSRFILETSNVSCSDYKGQVKMNLCKKGYVRIFKNKIDNKIKVETV